jgi:hypothetical protein
MGNLQIWNRVPDRSTFELAVTGDGPAAKQTFVASARLLVDNGAEEQWVDADLHPGPKTKRLASPRSYVVRIAVFFSGQATATIQARILKPDGSVHANPYTFAVSGKNGDTQRATILIVTQKT